jgi:two-component system, cell cycle sensor histidine kinase and response regulator CckA
VKKSRKANHNNAIKEDMLLSDRLTSSPDPHTLGKLLLLQETLHVISEDEGLSDFICKGLSEVPGIKALGICQNETFYPGQLPLYGGDTDAFKKNCIICKANAEKNGYRSEFCAAWGRDPAAACIELRAASRLYGFLLILKSDGGSYALYEPFLQNTANLIALLLENRRQHEALVDVRENLELAVKERTLEFAHANAGLRKEVQRHKQTAAALRRSEELQRTTLRSLGDAVIASDAEGKVVNMNPVAEQLTGWTLAAALGRPLTQVFVICKADTGDICVDPFERVMQIGSIVVLTNPTKLVSRDGRIYQITDSAAPILNDRGITIGVVLVFHDISKEYAMRQALLESEERYAAVIKQASEGIYLLNPETKQVLESNDSFKKMIGLAATDTAELVAYDFVAHPREEIDRIIKNVIFQKSFFVGERKYRRRDGSMFDVEASAKLIKVGGKEVLCVIARDITERKQAEEERERLEARLQQSQKMEAIGTLAGGIAHDFNNILSAIIGYSELLKIELPPDSPAICDINEIIRSGRRAADLVKQILTFSRKTDRALQVIAPHCIVNEVLKMLKATFPSTVTIEAEIDRECGNVLVDPTGLHQIVLNLCTNALQSLPGQKGVIRVRLYRQNGHDTGRDKGVDGPAVVLSVTDSGCGMSQETISRIFEPYFTTKEVGAGTGFGLAVVHGIVHDYKGHIVVDSTPGKGSTMSVHIPVSMEKPGVAEGSLASFPNMPSRETHSARILFVDDEPSLCSYCERLLKSKGYLVTTTTDSGQALEWVRLQPGLFDLVITDQTMPGLTGIELAREVLAVNPAIPIIMCTGHSDVVSETDALAGGVKRYVYKPFQKEQLLLTIREVMGETGD